MAGDAIVGALRVILGMDTSSFEDGAKKAAASAQSFGTQLKAVFAGVGLEKIVERVFDTITHAIKEGISSSIELADQMGKTAQKVGVSVEELSGLSLAANLSDVSMESLSKGLGILSKNMVDAARNTGGARDQFDALGIKVTDGSGKLKSVTDVLGDIADKFEHTSDGAAKTAAALAVLGKGGKDLIPLLNEGKGSLQEFAKVAENMGLVISQDFANKSQKFNDNLKILHLSLQGIANLVTEQLIDALVRLSDQFVENAKTGDTARAVADTIVSSFKSVVRVLLEQYEGLIILGEQWDIFKQIIFFGPDTPVAQLVEDFKRLGQEAPARMKDAGDAVDGFFAKISVAPKHLGDALDIPTTGITKQMDALSLKAQILAGNFDALPKGLPELAVKLGLTAENGTKLGLVMDQLSPQVRAFGERLLEIQAFQLVIEQLTPFQKYILALQEIEKLRPTFQKLGLDMEELTKKADLEAAKTRDIYGKAADAVVSPWASAFKTLAEQNKQFAGAAKALAIAEATIHTYVAANKALSLSGIPYPFNLIAAAGTVAAGLANVAKISATNFSTGGSFKVGGGLGGIDSQLISFKAQPGEMVDIHRPDQQRSGGASEITIRGVGMSDIFTGKNLRDLVEALNMGDRDGYRLKFAER